MPRDTLTSDQIVRAAIELLDDEGLDGLNMRALGKRLDAAATAMYWHVGNKDNLVRLATDEIWAEIELPDPQHPTWRTAAAKMADRMYAMITRHPWTVQALAGYLHYGPNKSRHDEQLLAIFEHAGFDDDDADSAAATLFTFVLGNAVGQAANVSLDRRLAHNGESAETRLAEAMSEAEDLAKQHPRLRRRIEKGATTTAYNAAPDAGFEFGLTALLDGFRDRLTRTERS